MLSAVITIVGYIWIFFFYKFVEKSAYLNKSIWTDIFILYYIKYNVYIFIYYKNINFIIKYI